MNKLLWIVALAALNWAAVSQAAPINWGPPTDVFSPTEVINSGTLIEAYNAGGNTSGSDQTVNGVPFAGTTVLLPNDDDSDCLAGDTGDAAYNALLGSIDSAGPIPVPKVPVPAGLNPGEQYRLVFITSEWTDATSSDINYYNTFVNTAATKTLAMAGLSWTALASTGSVNAQDNTGTVPGTDGAGIPIYTLDGVQIAASYADLWDGSLPSPLNINEKGDVLDADAWTGSTPTGTTSYPLGDPAGLAKFGQSWRYAADNPSWWFSRGTSTNTLHCSLYAISEVVTVPPPAPPVPAGLNPGDEYRLVFVTSTTRDATSTDIADYNAFVNTAAYNNPDLDAISWSAIASTATVDARDNTGTTGAGTGISIYTVTGTLVANNYTDLWDGFIANEITVNEQGDFNGATFAWTGTEWDGTMYSAAGLGTATPRFGNPTREDVANWWVSRAHGGSTPAANNYSMYAMSEVLTVPASPVTFASLEVGGGNLVVGTEYTIQVWYVDNRDSAYRTVGDGQSSTNTVDLSDFGQFVTGTFVADASTQTITLEAPAGSSNVAISAYQIRDRITAEEMMTNFRDEILPAFPDYSWDKVQRWGFARKNGTWTDSEYDILGRECKYIWIIEGTVEQERLLADYPDNMYCHDTYVNLGKAFHNPSPFNPELYMYDSTGEIMLYSNGMKQYNFANPDTRHWWVNWLGEQSYNEGPQTDVLFIDSIQKALATEYSNNRYDYWGNRVDNYMEAAIVPLLESVRDELSEDVIIQGNFLRAATDLTDNANMDYVEKYITSAYLEGFEFQSVMHETIEYVQQSNAMGKMLAPNFYAPSTCTDINAARAKASAAMPAFWAKLDTTEQDVLASMYYEFDFQLAYFLIMAGEHSYMRCQNTVMFPAGTDSFRIVPPFPEFGMKLGEPQSDGVRISDSTWEREFEYCKVTLNVDAETADIDWSYRANPVPYPVPTENLAWGKLSYQSSTDGVYTADRANDGNTDPNRDNGSVSCTGSDSGWWEVDLGTVSEIDSINIWASTYKSWLLKDVYVMVSDEPFYGDSLATNLDQPGVASFYIPGRVDWWPNDMASVPVDLEGRYVRVSIAGGLLNLAEVEVWSPGDGFVDGFEELSNFNNMQSLTAPSTPTGATGSYSGWCTAGPTTDSGDNSYYDYTGNFHIIPLNGATDVTVSFDTGLYTQEVGDVSVTLRVYYDDGSYQDATHWYGSTSHQTMDSFSVDLIPPATATSIVDTRIHSRQGDYPLSAIGIWIDEIKISTVD